MRTVAYDLSVERRILLYMATDKTVCSKISREWNYEGLFDSDWANLVGGLIVRYFRRYGKPPGQQLIALFENWAQETHASESEIDRASEFLEYLSEEPVDFSSTEYILDLAGRHFNKVVIRRQLETVAEDLDRDRVEDALETLSRFRRVNLGKGSYVEPAADVNAWINALERVHEKPLVWYRGNLADFVGDSSFRRGALYSFMAMDKVGKTSWLIDLTYRAIRNRKRVAYFDCGDSNEDELIIRLGCRALRRVPPWCKREQYVCLGWQNSGEPIVVKKVYETLDAIEGFRALEKVCSTPEHLRISCHPNSSLSVQDLASILSEWDEADDWRPDIVVVDYADILAPPPGVKDTLDQIDTTWKQLRRLSQERHCLVVTATQSNAKAYELNGGGLLARKHFGGRKTKLAHVNGMLGINCTPEEKEIGVARINWIVRRHDYFSEKDCCLVAGCMAAQSPAIVSLWPVSWENNGGKNSTTSEGGS